MRRVLASVGMALLVAARPAAAQELTIDWARTVVTGGVVLPGEGPDGVTALQLRATASGPTSFHLVAIDHPPVTTPGYVVAGQVRYEGVEGQGYLEMWSVFPDSERFFSRTLATEGGLAALHGESGWRVFELPFLLSSAAKGPSRLELNVVLPGRGTVWLGPMRLERYAPGKPLGAWWSERSGTLFGATLGSVLGLLGAMIGLLAGRGKARRLALGLVVGLVILGGSLLVLGGAALLSSQPRYVWYPPFVLGGLSAVVGLVVLRPAKLRYAADELRKMQAMDAGGAERR